LGEVRGKDVWDSGFPLVGRDSAGFFTSGSGVLLNSELGITAAHNVRHAFNQSVDDTWRATLFFTGNIKVSHAVFCMALIVPLLSAGQ